MTARDDKLLEDYLTGDSELSRRYREESGDRKPPAEIDDRLRAAARREVRAGPRRIGLLPAAWTRSLAAAAVVVLAVGVVLQLVRENDGVYFDEVESTLKHESRQKAGDAEPEKQLRGAAPPEAAPSAPQTLEYKQAPPTEQESGRTRGQARESEPMDTAPEQRSSGAAPDPALGDAAEPPGPASADDPQAWVDYIRRLAEQGQLDEARYYLARYYERFPARPVPRELLELLERRNAATEQ